MAADEHSKELERVSSSLNAHVSKAADLTARPSRFTTLEEEEARRQAQFHKSWIVTAAQVAALLVVITAIGGMAYYASRPASADNLYSSITNQIETGDPASLGKVENELNEFLNRYSDDHRAEELGTLKEKIELDKSERKLQRETKVRIATDTNLLPAEQLYLRAAAMAESSPEQALKMLEALVTLYGVEPPTPPASTDHGPTRDKHTASRYAARTTEVVQLARHRIDTLREEIAKQHERLLLDLAERLQAAEGMAKTDPARAATMYRAIIDLHQADSWAEPLVAKAREKLKTGTK